VRGFKQQEKKDDVGGRAIENAETTPKRRIK
jgi:hypothetical protein